MLSKDGENRLFQYYWREPFTRKDAVFELLAFLEGRPEIGHIDILSNGTLIDDSIISNLLRFKSGIQFPLKDSRN